MYRLHKEDILRGTNIVVLRPRQHGICKCNSKSSADANVWDNKAVPMPGNCPVNQLTEAESRQKGLWKEKHNTNGDRCMADAYGFFYSVVNAILAQVFLLSPCVLSAASVIMPLSSDQVTAFKNPDTKITFQDQKSKKGGSNAWGRYEKYKKCVSIAGATAAGANWQDLSSDFEKGYMKFPPRRMSRCQPPQKEQPPKGHQTKKQNKDPGSLHHKSLLLFWFLQLLNP